MEVSANRSSAWRRSIDRSLAGPSTAKKAALLNRKNQVFNLDNIFRPLVVNFLATRATLVGRTRSGDWLFSRSDDYFLHRTAAGISQRPDPLQRHSRSPANSQSQYAISLDLCLDRRIQRRS